MLNSNNSTEITIMKKTIYTIGVFMMCLFTGCDLDEPHYGKTTTDVFYKTEKGIHDALTGAYLQFRTTWNEYALGHYLVGDCTTDDALKGGGGDGDRGEVHDMAIFKVETTNGEVGRRWEVMYRIVNRSNDVIFYGPDADGDKDLLIRYVNEAKLLRAYGYYILVTSFGEVPLMTKPLTPSEILQVKRASKEEVYTLIESDLRDASALPSKGQYANADKYRVTRGLAKTMLAKLYMHRGMYVEAEKVLNEIVEVDKDYQLLPDFGMNWRKEYVNSSESIFELPNAMYDKTIGTGTNVPHFFTTRSGAGYSGYGFHQPTTDLYDAFDADDPRLTYTFTRSGDRYKGDTEDQNNSGSATGFFDYKMTVPRNEKEGYDVWMIPYNIRLIRYSDVLLLYAEALNENGKSSQALVYLNQVRERARNTNSLDPRKEKQAYVPNKTTSTLPAITTTDQVALRKAIWDERRRELAMEGWRRDDLIRQKRFGEVMRAYAAKYKPADHQGLFKGENFKDDKDYLLPIPQGERDKSQGNLTQNPNY